MHIRSLLRWAPGMAAALLGLATVAQAGTYTNPVPIEIVDASGGQASGGNPYPSSIVVAGEVGTITKVTVTLHNIRHSFAGDIDIMLVSPSGQNLVFFSDAFDWGNLADTTITFDDDAASLIVFKPASTGDVLPDGSYKPTNYNSTMPDGTIGVGSDQFPAPAPAFSNELLLSAFNGSNPNGEWRLFVVDDGGEDAGMIAGGWTLDITTAAVPLPPAAWAGLGLLTTVIGARIWKRRR